MRMLSLRLDEKAERELNYIKETLQESQSQVVKEAIHAYYTILLENQSQQSSAEMMMNSGYIGSFEAEKNLSTNYKKKLREGLQKKHGIK